MEETPVEEPVKEPIEAPVVKKCDKHSVSIQTEKKQMSVKQREALAYGRMLYKKNKELYKRFAEQQASVVVPLQKEEPIIQRVPPEIVTPKADYSIGFL